MKTAFKPTSPAGAELLKQTEVGLSAETWLRYDALQDKRRAETLTPVEHTKLIALNDKIEEDNVRRIKCVIELAKLRQTTLDDMMRVLKIVPRTAKQIARQKQRKNQ